jgi:ketosteroid isomerase-like protein
MRTDADDLTRVRDPAFERLFVHTTNLTEARRTAPMTDSPSAIEVVTRFGDCWAAHDLDGTLALVTDDCLFDATGPAPDGTPHVGRDAIRAAWKPIFDDTASSFDAEDTFEAEDRVVQLWRYSWDGGSIRGVDVFRVRDGLVSEKRSYVKG